MKIKKNKDGSHVIKLKPTECGMFTDDIEDSIHFINRNELQVLKNNCDNNSLDEDNPYKNFQNGKYTYENGQNSFIVLFMLYKKFIIDKEIDFNELLDEFEEDVEYIKESVYEDTEKINDIAKSLDLNLNDSNELNQMILILKIMSKNIKKTELKDINEV